MVGANTLSSENIVLEVQAFVAVDADVGLSLLSDSDLVAFSVWAAIDALKSFWVEDVCYLGQSNLNIGGHCAGRVDPFGSCVLDLNHHGFAVAVDKDDRLESVVRQSHYYQRAIVKHFSLDSDFDGFSGVSSSVLDGGESDVEGIL